ncbi:hypothetical protein GCM10028801_43530 [Nocardioides maradonensis]
MSASDPRSLLFLSCDIVGSTKYKQQQKIWQATFLSFYRAFPQMLGDLTREHKYEPGFTLWKPVGDELIFTTRVRSEADIYTAVRIWLRAMDMYERDALADVSLATKGGAFVATFPGPDSESSIPRNPTIETSDAGVVELNDSALANRTEQYLYDYFGPSIDTGFRVFSACSHRYFTLSVEVAWALAHCAVDAGADETVFPLTDLLLLETREFKGVWNGREYPLFALDRQHADLVNVALSRLRDRAVKPLDVVNLCRACADEPAWPSRLYLPDSHHREFTIVPEDSLNALRDNSMEGAETLPEDIGTDALEDEAPLPAPVATPTTPDKPQAPPA